MDYGPIYITFNNLTNVEQDHVKDALRCIPTRNKDLKEKILKH
jgi:hypothetical protein